MLKYKTKKENNLFEEDNILDEDLDDLDNFDNLNEENLSKDNSLGFDSDMQDQRHSDLLKGLTDFDPYLKQMVSEWLGMTWDETKGTMIKNPDLNPLMNVEGVRWCINFLRTYVRGNNIITNLKEDSYNNIMRDIALFSEVSLEVQREKFGIKDIITTRTIATQLYHSADLVLMGAGGKRNYQDLITGVVNINQNENISNQPNQNRQNPSEGFVNQAKKFLGL